MEADVVAKFGDLTNQFTTEIVNLSNRVDEVEDKAKAAATQARLGVFGLCGLAALVAVQGRAMMNVMKAVQQLAVAQQEIATVIKPLVPVAAPPVSEAPKEVEYLRKPEPNYASKVAYDPGPQEPPAEVKEALANERNDGFPPEEAN
jgi:hypothetical protein